MERDFSNKYNYSKAPGPADIAIGIGLLGMLGVCVCAIGVEAFFWFSKDFRTQDIRLSEGGSQTILDEYPNRNQFVLTLNTRSPFGDYHAIARIENVGTNGLVLTGYDQNAMQEGVAYVQQRCAIRENQALQTQPQDGIRNFIDLSESSDCIKKL